MLNRIVHTSLRLRWVVVILAMAMCGYGVFVAGRAKLDVFPEFVKPQVVVQAEAPGLIPEQVEILVTRPIENALNGVGGLESIRSESIQGLSVVTAVFTEGTDVFIARQALAEKLAEVGGQLPAGVRPPKMSPLTSSTMDLIKIGFVSMEGGPNPMELRTLADWTIRPRLLSVPGVARLNVFGGEVRQLQIQVDPLKLAGHDLTIAEVLTAARAATGVRGAGFIETSAQRLLIQTEGQILTVEELAGVVISHVNGLPLRLSDVADVTEGPEPKFGDCLVQGKEGVLLTVSGQYGANTLEVTQLVEKALDDMKPLFAANKLEVYPRLHRPATFIENALKNVQRSLLIGGVLVAIVLVLFLLDLRTAFISFVSIPIYLLAAVIVLDAFGVTLNTMTLGGFAVAVGVVVDDAIIDVENILRRLRENRALATPRPLMNVVLDASMEVRGAVVYATFIVALAFVPVLMMSGIQGRFFAPLGTAFILATLSSLLVALTLTPALCMILLGKAKLHREAFYLRWAKRVHEVLLRGLCRVPVLVLLALIAVSALGMMSLGHMGGELLPVFREGHFVAQVSSAPGTSLPEMVRLGRRVSADLLKIPEIATVEQQMGRAEQGEDTWSPNRSEFHIELKPGTPANEEESIQEHIREVLESYPGTSSEVLTFLGDRISETISGETSEVVVSVFGDDLDAVDSVAALVAAQLNKVPGSADVAVKNPPGAPRLAIDLRHAELSRLGFRPLYVLDFLETACQGTEVAQVYDGNRVEAVTVKLKEDVRNNPARLKDLLLANGSWQMVPLKVLANIYETTGRPVIQHDGARRRQIVTCNTSGRDVASFVADARTAIAANVPLPAGTYTVFSGAAQQQEEASRELLLHFGLSLTGIFILLAMVFRSLPNLILVLLNLPFAFLGGLLAVKFTGGEISLGALVGFVTLFGLTTRNSIMLMSHYEHLVKHEGCKWGFDTALRGALERFSPITMTATVTALGLLPLVLGSGEAGGEVEGPMAIVILGGLITSTVLNLLAMPSLALRWGKFDAAKEA